MEIIRFEEVEKYYDTDKPVIRNLNLTIKQGEFVTLIGPSGCGKTTLLKLINGLIKADKGKIYVQNKEINQWDPIELRRNIGYVIQQIGLFPHLTVADNISYVLDIKNENKDSRLKKAEELISLVGLDESYLHRYPRELSGGQKQRIGVARALAADPEIILMDEPFGAVDEISRKTLQDELLRIFSELNKTIVFVTHDIEEAIKLGTKVILMNKGHIEQAGTKEEMIFEPRNSFVKDFFGTKNFMAYLNVVNIKKVCSMVYSKEEIEDVSKLPALNESAAIMEGIKCLFDYGLDSIAIKDDKNRIVGKFSLKNLKQGIETQRNPDFR